MVFRYGGNVVSTNVKKAVFAAGFFIACFFMASASVRAAEIPVTASVGVQQGFVDALRRHMDPAVHFSNDTVSVTAHMVSRPGKAVGGQRVRATAYSADGREAASELGVSGKDGLVSISLRGVAVDGQAVRIEFENITYASPFFLGSIQVSVSEGDGKDAENGDKKSDANLEISSFGATQHGILDVRNQRVDEAIQTQPNSCRLLFDVPSCDGNLSVPP